MAGGDPLEVIFLIVSMFAEIYLYLFLVLKLYQLKRDGPLNFYLTDFWAVVVGLAPTYIVIIKIIQSHKATTATDLSPAATLLILQILECSVAASCRGCGPAKKCLADWISFCDLCRGVARLSACWSDVLRDLLELLRHDYRVAILVRICV